MTIVLIVVGIVVFLIVAVVVIVGILAALGIYGTRRYVDLSKQAEGRAQVRALAMGIVACAEQNHDLGKSEVLPATARAVPATLGEVSGRKYMSSPSDWSDPAYDCAKFSMSYPQYFQYQWVRAVTTDHGTAIATADLDGNGTPDATFEVPVTCSAGSCTAAPAVEK